MTKRRRQANRTKTAPAKAAPAPFKSPHPDPWKRPAAPGVLAGALTNALGVVRSAEDDDPIAALSELLRKSGARMTFDRRANVTHPCWRCDKADHPRSLEKIGIYTRFPGGSLEPGDAILRPLCEACKKETGAGAGDGELGHAEALIELAEERTLRERLADICTRTARALRGPPPDGTLWSWHDLPDLAAKATATPTLDVELFCEALEQVIDEKPADVESFVVDEFGTRRAARSALAMMTRRAGVATTRQLIEKVLVVYRAWRAAKPRP